MAKSWACISIGPSALRVLRVRGTRVEKEAVRRLRSSEWHQHWTSRLSPLDGLLAEALGEAGLGAGVTARVLFDSPDARADLVHVPVAGESAVKAAELAFGEGLPFSISSNAHGEVVLSGDGSGSMVLCAADRDEHVTVLCEWLRRAQLRVGGLTPRAAAVIAMMRGLVGSGTKPVAHVHVGPHGSVIVGSDKGELRFVRTLSMGWSMLGEAARTACVSAGHECGEHEVERALRGRGLPGRDDTWPIGAGVSGSVVLPALQPVLQRFGVEIRQTVRFGFGAAVGVRAGVRLLGDGGRIGGLGEVLSGQIELDVRAEEALDDELVWFAGQGGALLSLLPAAVVEQRQTASTGRGLRIGAAIAVGLLVGEAAMTYSVASRTEIELKHARVELERAQAEDERFDRAVELADRVMESERALRESVGGDVAWGVVFDQIAGSTDETVRLSEARFALRGGSPKLTIEGFVFGDEQTGPERLSSYLHGLSERESVLRVQSGSTRMSAYEGRTAVAFSAELDLVSLPTSVVAMADGGAER